MSRDKLTSHYQADHHEAGVEVPYDRINPETLRNLIQEYVTRDGADWDEAGCKLEDKCEQVLQQLRIKRVKVVFDLTSQTANIVVCR
ncbi:MAG: YheU family protein [Desulfuromonadales bacterium]|nr:YheU family protein [Desulfuromonadales bacterium]